MSVFESPPCRSIRMDQDQMYSLGSLGLREDALDDMLCRICLKEIQPEHEASKEAEIPVQPLDGSRPNVQHWFSGSQGGCPG